MIIGYPPKTAGELKKRIRQVVAGMGKKYEKTSVISGIPGSFCVSMDDLASSEPFLLVRDNDVPKAKLIGKRLQMELRLDVEVGKLEAFYGRDDGPVAKPSYPVKAIFILEAGAASLRLIHEACGGKAKAEFQDLHCGPKDMKNLVISCLDCSFDQTILTNREMRRELGLVVSGKQEEAALGFGLVDKKCIVFKNPT
jgi:hypothetical protein